MKIVADENIPLVREAFGPLGELVVVSGRSLGRAAVADANVLLVRSVTKVNRDLLEGTRVRFVGTATIGTDHVDQDYLAEQGIAFTSAAGSNANSVAEYVAAALLVLAQRLGVTLEGRTLGVVGVGNVGSRIVRNARALGMNVLGNDPPLEERGARDDLVSLEEALGADFLTLHVPLERETKHPTHHLADADFFARLRKGAVLINTSRGPVVDTPALMEALDSGHVSAAALDVWEGEPDIGVGMLRRTAIATGHIAGYSLDGKVAGTVMLYRAACAFLGVAPAWSHEPLMPAAPVPCLDIDAGGRADEDVLRDAVLGVYDIMADDARLRVLLDLDPAERPAHFDRLRRQYPIRREFPHTTLALDNASPALARKLRALGFVVEAQARGD